jgi:hypothetical protein
MRGGPLLKGSLQFVPSLSTKVEEGKFEVSLYILNFGSGSMGI